mmetsp:Transcript_176512/g.565934  ORF Transcript_176512/g.565934 Transcript_176512/m.565934 type:complete len:258 (+) Transcript_176512:1484-2257(+)
MLNATSVRKAMAPERGFARIFSAACSVTWGIVLQDPEPSNSHPWYAHCKRPVLGSIRPSDKGANRWGHMSEKTCHASSPSFPGTFQTTKFKPSMRQGVGRIGSNSKSDAMGNQCWSRQAGADWAGAASGASDTSRARVAALRVRKDEGTFARRAFRSRRLNATTPEAATSKAPTAPASKVIAGCLAAGDTCGGIASPTDANLAAKKFGFVATTPDGPVSVMNAAPAGDAALVTRCSIAAQAREVVKCMRILSTDELP